ncbi:MAG: creatininase family protein [Lentisphaeria bacterium]|nr:creatininase family protein [Lentisphaeria bacterium]
MRYLYMQPSQIRDAVKRNIPVVLPLGVIEYHAEHLPIGTDYFIAEKVLNMVEEQYPDDMVLLPPFYYGTATCAVADPENNGTINVSPEKIIPVAEDIFKGLLEVGFRNIHCFIAHQTEGFYQGMPTDLAFRFAGRKIIFEFLDKKNGRGWWGNEENAQYYTGGNNPFNYIRVHPVRTRESTQKKFKGDHTGVLETSEMLVIHPETVSMEKIDDSLWYARTAHQATKEFGEDALRTTAEDVKIVLFGE